MSEFEEKFNEYFFIIDSNNLNDINTEFYGFTIIDKEIITNKSNINESELNGIGSYINITNKENKIIISQDYKGSWGLYLYQNKDYFALSNSFLKLVEYLKDTHPISLNKEYADAFLYTYLCSFSYKETLINEIQILPKNYKIIINKTNKHLDFEKTDYKSHSISIDSKEGLETLDLWYYKWVDIIRSIKSKTNNLSIDLSGGFDSRVIAALWLTANIDIDKVRIKSHNDGLHSHDEDYQIASEIANEFGFKLNKSSFSYNRIPFEDLNTSIDISFYTKLGFHKQMYYKFSQASEPVYTITGEGGGSIRGYPDKTPEELLEHVLKISNKKDKSLSNSIKLIVKRTWKNLMQDYNLNEYSKLLTEIHYKEVRARYHCGMAAVESFFSNWHTLTPLLDSDLHKLDLNSLDCEDRMLLLALIYTRYCPKLLDFEFERQRFFDESTLEFAKNLNDTHPFKAKDYEFITGPDIKKPMNNSKKEISDNDIINYLNKILYSKSFELNFKKYYSNSSYDFLMWNVAARKFHPLMHFYGALAIMNTINYIDESNHETEWRDFYIDTFKPELDMLTSIRYDLVKYSTARIDIINYNANSEIRLIENTDIYSKVSNPKRLKDKEGKKFFIQSSKGLIDLKLECEIDSELELSFRTINTKDLNGNSFPIHIDYRNITINGETILENKLLSFKTPFVFKYTVDKPIVEIHMEWMPFNKYSEFNDESKINYESIKNENKNLKSELNDIYNSRSWKLSKLFRKLFSIFKID